MKIRGRAATALIGFGLLSCATAPARAVDGCEVLLCLAGNWESIGQCVPPVEQAFKDAIFGSFPTCSFVSGTGIPTSAYGHTPASAGSSLVTMAQGGTTPDPSCPVQYVTSYTVGDTPTVYYGCQYTNAVTVSIGGQRWSTTYFVAGPAGGASVSYFDPIALVGGRITQSAQWLADLQAYQAAQAAAAAAAATASAGGGVN